MVGTFYLKKPLKSFYCSLLLVYNSMVKPLDCSYTFQFYPTYLLDGRWAADMQMVVDVNNWHWEMQKDTHLYSRTLLSPWTQDVNWTYIRRSEDVLDVLDLERFGSDSNTFTYRVTLLELSSSCNKFLTLRIFYS